MLGIIKHMIEEEHAAMRNKHQSSCIQKVVGDEHQSSDDAILTCLLHICKELNFVTEHMLVSSGSLAERLGK